MGIVCDKHFQVPPAGEMILFTNPEGGIELTGNIRGAIDSRLSLYAYRAPGAYTVSFGVSEGYVEGIGIPGFVVTPFLPGSTPVTIPFSNRFRNTESNQASYRFPPESTSREEYEAEVENLKKAIEEAGGGKIVAARVKVSNVFIDPVRAFSTLCRQYRNAFVFLFSTPATGCWIGASPELLLSSHNDRLETVALAGTRERGSSEEWDAKNLEEQRMVTDYICDCFRKHGLSPETGELVSAPAGPVEHLCTPVSTSCDVRDAGELASLLQDLSPTPALCGMPREMALKAILENEIFERGCYGGYCGPFRSVRDFRFNVVLRCAMLESKGTACFAGGGITLRSDPEKEWEETEMKLSTLSDVLTGSDEISEIGRT